MGQRQIVGPEQVSQDFGVLPSFLVPDSDMRRSLLGFATETVQSWMDDSFSYIGWMKPTDSMATRFSPGRDDRNFRDPL